MLKIKMRASTIPSMYHAPPILTSTSPMVAIQLNIIPKFPIAIVEWMLSCIGFQSSIWDSHNWARGSKFSYSQYNSSYLHQLNSFLSNLQDP